MCIYDYFFLSREKAELYLYVLVTSTRRFTYVGCHLTEHRKPVIVAALDLLCFLPVSELM